MPPTPEPLAGVKAKIERAYEHIGNFDSESGDALRESYGKVIAFKTDPSNGHRVYYLTGDIVVPPVCSAIAADVMQNLRSALDHLAYRLCVAGYGSIPEDRLKNLYFPIAPKASDYPGRVTGTIEGLAKPEAVKAVRLIEAYKGGKEEILWVINDLNRIDKHRLLITLAMEDVGAKLGPKRWEAMRKHVPDELQGRIDTTRPVRTSVGERTLKAGDVLFVDPFPEIADEQVEFPLHVALDEPGIIPRRALLPLLTEMADAVSGVVNVLEPYAT